MVEMRYRSMVTTAFLMIPLFIPSNVSAEIFELVNVYEINAADIVIAPTNILFLEYFCLFLKGVSIKR